MMRCVVLPDAAAVATEAARRIAARIVAVQAEGRHCRLVLAGGDSPRAAYRLLSASTSLDTSRLEIFWSDERAVPPQHESSNQRMVRQAWLDHVPIPPAHIHPMRGDAADLQQAAREYESVLRDPPDALPRFDLVLLGLGEDAHTASLFPGSPAIEAVRRLVAVTRAPDGSPRLTLTPPALIRGDEILFLVIGSRKATALRRVLREPLDPLRLPPHALASARPLFLVDREAAGESGR